jgi:hypothetical protein
LTATGTADAKVLAYSVAPAAYYNGQRFAFIANTTNTGSATLNVNSLGAKTIKKDVSGTLTNLSASDMVSGMFVEVAYNTSNDCFVWVNRWPGSFSAGSASAPSITPTGDTNTGFWFPAADTIAASTAGTERVRVDSSGNVGIGTSTPGVKLEVSDGTTRIAAGYIFSTTSYMGTISNHNWGIITNNIIRATMDTSGNFLLSTSGGGFGYGTGSGGTVTQLTSRTTGVTLNKTNGAITLFTAAGSTTPATFNVANSTVAATDTIIVNVKSSTNVYFVSVSAIVAGSFNITFYTTGGTASDAPVFNFSVIKAVTS